MQTPIVKIDPAYPEQAFTRCRDVIRAGGVIVYPTDTLYGLGADPKNPAAVKKLFTIKRRQADQPILLLIRDANEVRDWAAAITPGAGELMRKFWPGPLTLVFKARSEVPAELTGGTGTIGLRVPGNALTRQLLASLGTALTGTSANISSRQSPRTAREAAEAIGGMADLVLDGGRTEGGNPSTVVDVSDDEPRMIREGAIPSREILG
ncbi:MAG: L-threonylcarbamoyladenylate synthase [Nitrospirae bacterium]|nr:L-threonylcarbamoyladenylate synthase [Nitrospirota bacterium]